MRIGRALVKDREVAKKMTKFIELSTIGVSNDSQLRAAKVLRTVSDSCEEENSQHGESFFRYSYKIMEQRWKLLNAAVEGSHLFSLPKFTSAFCNFLNQESEPQPAFAWLKCEGDLEDCEMFLRGHKIFTRSGRQFGASPKYALDRMGHVDEIVNDPDYKFEFPTPDDRPGAPIISFSDASFGYPGGPILFKNLNFGIDLDSRIAMVGPNGIGKSTILKLIAGELQPSSGTVFRSAKVRIAVFSQHHVDGLDLSSNPLLYMMRCYPGVPEQKLRGHLGSFGVTGNLALQPMYTLSGGQKSRVAFAKITFKKPHIILLDEPSNHLDLDAVEALIQGLVMFQGGILMVSHDEHLISGSVEELWAVSEGRVTPFHGSFQDYKKILQS